MPSRPLQERVGAILSPVTLENEPHCPGTLSGPPTRVLAFVLPYPPSANRIWRRGRTWDGRPVIHKSDEAKAYEWAVKINALRHLDHAVWDAMTPPFALCIRLYPPDRRRS